MVPIELRGKLLLIYVLKRATQTAECEEKQRSGHRHALPQDFLTSAPVVGRLTPFHACQKVCVATEPPVVAVANDVATNSARPTDFLL